MSVRGGEDTYTVSAAASAPITAECLTFPDRDGASLAATVALCTYGSLAEIYHGAPRPGVQPPPGPGHRLQ